MRDEVVDRRPIASPRDRALGILALSAILALLYLGRTVLIPLVLALVLSLVVSPLVQLVRRTGLGQRSSILVAMLTCTLLVLAAAVVLGTQVLRMAQSLPQYQHEIQQKLRKLNDATLGQVSILTGAALQFLDRTPGAVQAPAEGTPSTQTTPIPVEVHQPPASPLRIGATVLASIWVPVESTGIVLVVLIFVLLEHEALRDRFIRVAGGSNIRLTTLALNDAGERLSRFFVSQFAVNLGVGAAIGAGLEFIGLPQALVWGALATVLRFVPYIGVWIAALLATVLAIAVAPGWSLAISTLGLFVIADVIASQLVEPQLYGHTTGLSPLSVVVSAIFWSALWGPIGLVLSTPLTLCILVVGRHIQALSFLELLLGDTQALTLAQKFYQRALSGDGAEIIALARAFLKRNTFAVYCDVVLMPALQLSFLDFEMGAIGAEQEKKLRDVLVTVVSALSDEPRRLRRRVPTVLDDQDPGRVLRRHREQLIGKWQGPIVVPSGSVQVCMGMASIADTIAAELLVRALRLQRFDARHLSIEDLDEGLRPPDATPDAVAIVYLVSAIPGAEPQDRDSKITRLRQRFPGAKLVAVLSPGVSQPPKVAPPIEQADRTVTRFEEAIRVSLERPVSNATGSGRPSKANAGA